MASEKSWLPGQQILQRDSGTGSPVPYRGVQRAGQGLGEISEKSWLSALQEDLTPCPSVPSRILCCSMLSMSNPLAMPFAQGGGRLLQLLRTPRCSKVQAPTLPRAELSRSSSLARLRCPIHTGIRSPRRAGLALLPAPPRNESVGQHSQHQVQPRHLSKCCIRPQNPPNPQQSD